MSSVNASSGEVRKLAAALKRYQNEVTQASRAAQKAVGSAALKDAQKQKFDARFRDHSKQVNRFFTGDLDEMIKYLNELARKLEDIERMNI